ncbi:hypothetical protein ACT7DH_10765 [Bacillus pacificus]
MDLTIMMYPQSFEFRKAGYTVGVSVQRDAWCIHYHIDGGMASIMTSIERYLWRMQGSM